MPNHNYFWGDCTYKTPHLFTLDRCPHFYKIFLACLFYFFIFRSILPTRVSVHECMPGVQEGQKTASNLLGLDLQRVVRFCMGAGSQA